MLVALYYKRNLTAIRCKHYAQRAVGVEGGGVSKYLLPNWLITKGHQCESGDAVKLFVTLLV